MKKGFTLVELLAVIVILAILALIATPVVLNVINKANESTKLRSAEFYLEAVEQSVLRKNINEADGFIPVQCQIIQDGNLNCDGKEISVEVEGEVPKSGTIIFEDYTISKINLVYGEETIVMNEQGVLDYQ